MGLYVPAGFPHTTDTVHTSGKDGDNSGKGEEEEEEEVDSVHVTVGLDTHIWGLTLGAMANGLIAPATSQPESSSSTAAAMAARSSLDESLYWNSYAAVPKCLGFLRQHFHPVAAGEEGEGNDSQDSAREAAADGVLAAGAALDSIGSAPSSKALTPAAAKAAVSEAERHLSALLEV